MKSPFKNVLNDRLGRHAFEDPLALDEETGRKILDYIWKLKEKLGFTLIMVTHNQNIADMARTIIRVNSGKITEVVTNDQPQTAYEIGW